jgi:hypothetical protein
MKDYRRVLLNDFDEVPFLQDQKTGERYGLNTGRSRGLFQNGHLPKICTAADPTDLYPWISFDDKKS